MVRLNLARRIPLRHIGAYSAQAHATRERLVSNILTVYRHATSSEHEHGAYWYADAQALAAHLASAHGRTLEQTAGVIAALSPNTTWKRNAADAEVIISGYVGAYSRRRFRVSAYPANVRKALRILQGAAPLDVLGGRKVRAFYRLIVSGGADSFAVCVDGHAANIAYLRRRTIKNAGLRDAEFLTIAQAYRVAAARLSLDPHKVQAITWTVWRASRGLTQGRLF